jgi:hypothetical protein
MKSIFIYTGLLLIFLNSIIGLILNVYDAFNWITNDVIILFNILIMLQLTQLNVKDGFKIGLGFLFPIIAILEFVLGIVLKNRFEDNIYLILILILVFIQIVLLIIGKIISKNV